MHATGYQHHWNANTAGLCSKLPLPHHCLVTARVSFLSQLLMLRVVSSRSQCWMQHQLKQNELSIWFIQHPSICTAFTQTINKSMTLIAESPASWRSRHSTRLTCRTISH